LENLPRTVAVVEDDASVRRSIERLLNANGYKSASYTSAEAFLDRKDGIAIFCLVLDIQLGAMTGMQLQRWLRESGSTLPVIFVTAMDDELIEAQAREAGCVAFLHKPFEAKLLICEVEKAFAALSQPK
jgi:FixJ family two-component response regulator